MSVGETSPLPSWQSQPSNLSLSDHLYSLSYLQYTFNIELCHCFVQQRTDWRTLQVRIWQTWAIGSHLVSVCYPLIYLFIFFFIFYQAAPVQHSIGRRSSQGLVVGRVCVCLWLLVLVWWLDIGFLVSLVLAQTLSIGEPLVILPGWSYMTTCGGELLIDTLSSLFFFSIGCGLGVYTSYCVGMTERASYWSNLSVSIVLSLDRSRCPIPSSLLSAITLRFKALRQLNLHYYSLLVCIFLFGVECIQSSPVLPRSRL